MAIYGQFSCDMPTELLKKGVGWQDRAVYAEAALFCRKELTDGVIDRVLLAMWMIDMPPKERAQRLDRMVTLSALRKHKRGWCFPPHVWAEWGVMKADVDAKRAAEAQRKADYRAKLSQRDKRGTDENVPPDATHVSEPVPDSKSKRQRQSKRKSNTRAAAAQLNVGDQPIDAAAAAAIDLLVEHDIATGRASSPTGWRHTMPARYLTEHGTGLRAHIENHPDATPAEVAQAVLGLTELDLYRLAKEA